MASAIQLDIQKLYVAYFNRPADADGLVYWEKVVVAANGNTAGVYSAFAASAEYKATFANMDAYAIVNQIYTNLFGRPAEKAGLDYWAEHLLHNRLPIDIIVKSVAEGARLSDLNIFNNKVTAASAFTAALNTPSEVAAYAATHIAPAARAFLSTVTTDASLATTLANIDALVLAVLQTPVRYELSAGRDDLSGTGADETFLANGTANLLQAGDRVDGGAGNDRLEALLSKDTASPVAADTTAVETVAINARVAASGIVGGYAVSVDPQRMLGVTGWESNNSTADVLIQGARIQDRQSTSDMTVAMVETAAGNVDMGVYFAADSVRAYPRVDTTLRLQLIDTRSPHSVPLQDNPYYGFAFYFNGVLTTLTSQAIGDAQTYDQLITAIRTALSLKPGLGNIVVSKGAQFTVYDPGSALRSGTEINLFGAGVGDQLSAIGPGTGWLLPPVGIIFSDASVHNFMTTAQIGAPFLASVKVVLDDVGRGGTGGDLVIGAADADSGAFGVGRFEIEVRDNSALQTITSTNNNLREVILKNGVTTSGESIQNMGNLTVQGGNGPADAGTDGSALPGSGLQHGIYGFSDVRVIDGSLMTGKLSFDAEITNAAMSKYNKQPNPDSNEPTLGAHNVNIIYSGGANDDTIDVNIDGNVLGPRFRLYPDYGDTTFTANGGAGNDSITVALNNGVKADSADWYLYQASSANLSIHAGEGDDIVRKVGAGNAVIDLGGGNDTVYADNSTSPSDNTITGGLGNDVIVLGTTVGTDAKLSSNDTLVYASNEFGNDVVRNFVAGSGVGADMLSFTALGGTGAGFAGALVSNAHGAVTVQAQTDANNTLANIAALYTDGSVDAAHLFIAYDAGNVGKVYTAVDSASGGVTVTLVGTIDLADTGWSTLVAANFV